MANIPSMSASLNGQNTLTFNQVGHIDPATGRKCVLLRDHGAGPAWLYYEGMEVKQRGPWREIHNIIYNEVRFIDDTYRLLDRDKDVIYVG